MAYKVIVADGSPTVQKIVQMAFPAADFEIFPFENGNDVVEAMGRINPDAVLISLSLSGKDGYDIGRFLQRRDEFRRTAVVFLREAFEPLDREKLEGLEYEAVVRKPFDSEKLARMVREVIDRKKFPGTFPEEPFPDEAAPEEHPSGEDEISPLLNPPEEENTGESESLVSGTAEAGVEVNEAIRRVVREEILELERELEKRLRVGLLSDLRRQPKDKD